MLRRRCKGTSARKESLGAEAFFLLLSESDWVTGGLTCETPSFQFCTALVAAGATVVVGVGIKEKISANRSLPSKGCAGVPTYIGVDPVNSPLRRASKKSRAVSGVGGTPAVNIFGAFRVGDRMSGTTFDGCISKLDTFDGSCNGLCSCIASYCVGAPCTLVDLEEDTDLGGLLGFILDSELPGFHTI